MVVHMPFMAVYRRDNINWGKLDIITILVAPLILYTEKSMRLSTLTWPKPLSQRAVMLGCPKVLRLIPRRIAAVMIVAIQLDLC